VQLEVAQPGRQRQDVHLPAGVVHVELARHIPAGEAEQAGQAGAVGGAAAVADVQRAGRVGRDELDLDAFPAAQRALAEIGALRQHPPAPRCSLAAGASVKLMKPAPATSALATSGDTGSSASRRPATSRGFLARSVGRRAPCACARRWSRSGRSSSSSARCCRPGATCCRPTSPTSWPCCRTACRPSLGAGARRAGAAFYGKPVGEVFADFERTPVASASVAQVHFAVPARRHARCGEDAAAGHRARHRPRPRPARRAAGCSRSCGRRPPPEAARGGRRVRQAPARRAGPDARGGQLRAAAAQLPAFAAADRARGALGLVRAQGHGDGAHARHADLAATIEALRAGAST
jgi:hypothetical protein